MESISIVTYPTITEYSKLSSLKNVFRDYEQYPLGTLIVASVLRTNGNNVYFLDANQEYYRFIEAGNNPDDFCDALSTKLARNNSSLYGLSTICSSYHITLIIAKQLKNKRPDCTIFLGGPQASATAQSTMKACPYIDFILCGEVEDSLCDFVKYHKVAPEKVLGLYWRNSENEIKNNSVSIPNNMDLLPSPAFDLYQPIFKRNSINIEAGRGCPNNCRFCSTSKFFGRSYRLKSANKLIDEVIELSQKYKLNFVKFNHDNMFFNREKFFEFYKQWISEDRVRSIRWGCSLRIDFVSAEIANMLAKCNCISIFIGIESGSTRMQKNINKHIDLIKAKQSLDYLHSAGITTTVSFIIGFPEETEKDLKETLDFYYEMLCKKLSYPQIGTLSPVAGSKYYEEHFNELSFYNNFSCMAHQGTKLSENYIEFLRSSPELFSAHYSIPLKHLDNKFILNCVKMLNHATAFFRYLLAISAYCVGDLYTLTLLWKSYTKDDMDNVDYYSSYSFFKNYLLFVSKLPENSLFKKECKNQFMFVLDAYDLRENEYEFLTNLDNKRKKIDVLYNDDFLNSSCFIKETTFSFSEVAKAFNSNMKIENLKMKNSRIIIYLNEDQFIVEEPSLLTYSIVRCFEDGKKVSNAVKYLCENYSHTLPDSVDKKAGFLYSIKALVNRGLLVSNTE